MSQQDPRYPGLSFMSPYLCVVDVAKSVDFYQRAFGCEVKEINKDEKGVAVHAELFYRGESFMVGLEGKYDNFDIRSPKTSGVSCPIFLYAYVNDIDNFYKKALAAGATSVTAPEDTFWGDRMCRVADLDGYGWGFATHISK